MSSHFRIRKLLAVAPRGCRDRAALRPPRRRGARGPRHGPARQLAVGRGAAEPHVHPGRLGLDGVELHARPDLPHERRQHASTTARSARRAPASARGERAPAAAGSAATTRPTPTPRRTTRRPDYGEAPFYASAFNKIWYNPNITYAPARGFHGHEPRQRQHQQRERRLLPRRRQHQRRERVQRGDLLQHLEPDGRGPHQPRQVPQERHPQRVAVRCRAAELLPLLGSHRHQRRPSRPRRSTTRSSSISSNAHYYNIDAARVLQRREPRELRAGHRRPALAGRAQHDPRADPLVQDGRRRDEPPSVQSGNSGGTPICQKKFDASTYKYPRYGRFTRVDIVASHGHLSEGHQLRPHRLRRRHLVHLRRGNPELRQLVDLLPHAHGAHEDGHRPRVHARSTTASASASSPSTPTTRSPPTSS